MAYQYKLALRNLKCCLPECRNEAAYGDWFCSMDCAEKLRIAQLKTSSERRALAVTFGLALGMMVITFTA